MIEGHFSHEGERYPLVDIAASHYVPTPAAATQLHCREAGVIPPYLILWMRDGRKLILQDPDLIARLLPHL